MINYKKEKLIKKHLGVSTPDWIVQNCIKMLNEFEDISLTIPVVDSSCKFYMSGNDTAMNCANCGEPHYMH